MNAQGVAERAGTAARSVRHSIRAFYSRPLGWLALIVTSGVLAYGGGGVMFWFHAIYRGEDGPPINDWWHWAFDSSLGFMALTPALFFILPLALAGVHAARIRGRRYAIAAYVILVGVAFGVVTGPGPILHNALVGADTPLGEFAVDVFGRDPAVAARVPQDHSTISEVVLQVAVGIPVYIAAGVVALAMVRSLAGARVRP